MFRILHIALLLMFSSALTANAQESRVWIDGTSSVNSFTCSSSDVEGPGLLAASDAHIEVPVETLDCGNGRMNKDLRAALRSNEYPLIRFELSRIDAEDGGSDTFQVETSGRLIIAGVARDVSLTLESRRQPNGRIRTTGSTPLQLTSFGIEPPTALLGLVKVHDRVVVHFDLVEPVSGAVAAATE